MNKILKRSLFLLACTGVGLCGLWVGYRSSVKKIEAPAPSQIESRAASLPAASQETPTPFAAPEKIEPATKMVYQYYYEDDGKIEITEEDAPYFLLDMTEEALREIFTEWELLSFSPQQVVMQKTMAGKSNQYYILGVQDGYVAVFYTEAINGSNLKEITGTPVLSLPAEEQRKLREGIQVEGYERLLKLLEDYGS